MEGFTIRLKYLNVFCVVNLCRLEAIPVKLKLRIVKMKLKERP